MLRLDLPTGEEEGGGVNWLREFRDEYRWSRERIHIAQYGEPSQPAASSTGAVVGGWLVLALIAACLYALGEALTP